MKKEFLTRVREKTGRKISLKDTKLCIDAIFDAISDSLYEKKKVTIRDFGSFIPIKRPAGTSRNPKTGEQIKVGERISVRFKPVGKLRKGL
jgi:DNA-binding protein HU-beta